MRYRDNQGDIVNLTASNEGIALLGILSHASIVVQFVMLLLLGASLVSWTMIFRKWSFFKAAARAADRFESRFWSGGNINQMFQQLSRNDEQLAGMDGMFVAGFREFSRLEKQKGIQPAEILEGVQRAMRVALTREIEVLEMHLSFLATVGSTSPYVGLFGTVWGIMHSFQGLSMAQQATIASVAPGIAEALIATAMGLFAAIPAVIAYNRYSHDVERLVTRYEIFMEEFASILQRQAFLSKA
jgi:biopolymer transport protein TolQ